MGCANVGQRSTGGLWGGGGTGNDRDRHRNRHRQIKGLGAGGRETALEGTAWEDMLMLKWWPMQHGRALRCPNGIQCNTGAAWGAQMVPSIAREGSEVPKW